METMETQYFQEHLPDKWVVVRIEGGEFPLTYKVFACWQGGYLEANRWKMNSGIQKVEEEKTHWVFTGFSGSRYLCGKKQYGLTYFGDTVLGNFIEKAKTRGVSLEILPPETDWKNLLVTPEIPSIEK